MKISVIVPVYNVEKFLDRCVESIVKQTYKNLEIILVDDGSPDNCPQICNDWAKKDDRIIVIHKKNGGASSARNAGISASSGDYIAFVDGDDYIDCNMYKEMLDTVFKHNADCAACGVVRESANGFTEVWADGSVKEFSKTELMQWIGEANGLLPVSPCNKLFSRSCVKNVRFDENLKYAEDTLFNFMVGKNINKLVLRSEPYYHYVNNAKSASHAAFDESRFDEHKVMDIIFEAAKYDDEIYAYCIKGDVMKSFRTIREMCVSGNCLDRFYEIRRRIVSNKNRILFSGIYSRQAKMKTLFLLLAPCVYKHVIKLYGVYSDRKYQRLTEA